MDHLVIGGSDVIELAVNFGTPLYIYDETTLRQQCTEFRTEFARHYPDSEVIYADKAFLNPALVRILKDEGLGLDCVSAGEISIAREAGFPLHRAFFHGNNKSVEELKLALKWQVGRIVVDNFHEMDMLKQIAAAEGARPDILLRLSPAVDPHTHKYISTGIIDSKFGFTLSDWEEAVAQASAAPQLNLLGLHFHIGSLIHETEPYVLAIDKVLEFAAEMQQKHNFVLKELNTGGGFAIQYTRDLPAPPIATYAEVIGGRITQKARELGMLAPRLIVEPGRSIVGRAGVAIYEIGAIKEIPDVRCYASVDGGMGDNIRPALYEASYEAVLANRVTEEPSTKVTIAGKFCESGDILIKDITLPTPAPGDIIALPGSGAYCLAMSSNYNASLRPAVVMVREGEIRLIRRRETFADLTRCDVA